MSFQFLSSHAGGLLGKGERLFVLLTGEFLFHLVLTDVGVAEGERVAQEGVVDGVNGERVDFARMRAIVLKLITAGGNVFQGLFELLLIFGKVGVAEHVLHKVSEDG